ncbi:MAG: hypothetical protein FJX47_18915 [Alphaproteobacteria bacterium]|nr:hypothetical protein [Alphaproteobacteria bacterium]
MSVDISKTADLGLFQVAMKSERKQSEQVVKLFENADQVTKEAAAKANAGVGKGKHIDIEV